MKRTVFVLLIALLAFFAIPQPEAKAFDPAIVSLIAPIAIKAAQATAPYIIKGAISTGKGLLLMGEDTFTILLLPAGMLESSFGAPFGLFDKGVLHMLKGSIAPFKLCFHAVTLPIRMFGVNMP